MNKEKKNTLQPDVEDLVLSTLGNATRREILKLIKKNPNITYTDIMKAMHLDTGTLNYHLSKMADFLRKEDNKYQLSKLGEVAVDTMEYLHSQVLLSRQHVYSLFNNFVLLRLGDVFLAQFRPKIAFKKITETRVSYYFPIAFLLFILTDLMGVFSIFNNGTNYGLVLIVSMLTFILLLLFLPFIIVKTVETLWQTKKSYLDVATLLMISYVPNFLYGVANLIYSSAMFTNLRNSITLKLSSIYIIGIPLYVWLTGLISFLLLLWAIYIFFTALRVYFDLSRGQTLVILIFSGFLYLVLELVILSIFTILSLAIFLSEAS